MWPMQTSHAGMGMSSWNPVLHVTRNFFLIKKELNQQVTVFFGSISGTSFIPSWGQTTNWTKQSPFPNNCSAVAKTGITQSFFWKCLMETQLLKSPALWASLPTGWDMGTCLPSQRSRVLRMSNSFTFFFSVSQNSSAALTLQPFLCRHVCHFKDCATECFCSPRCDCMFYSERSQYANRQGDGELDKVNQSFSVHISNTLDISWIQWL